MLIRVSWGKVRHFPLIDYNLKIKNLKKQSTTQTTESS